MNFSFIRFLPFLQIACPLLTQYFPIPYTFLAHSQHMLLAHSQHILLARTFLTQKFFYIPWTLLAHPRKGTFIFNSIILAHSLHILLAHFLQRNSFYIPCTFLAHFVQQTFYDFFLSNRSLCWKGSYSEWNNCNKDTKFFRQRLVFKGTD